MHSSMRWALWMGFRWTAWSPGPRAPRAPREYWPHRRARLRERVAAGGAHAREAPLTRGAGHRVSRAHRAARRAAARLHHRVRGERAGGGEAGGERGGEGPVARAAAW